MMSGFPVPRVAIIDSDYASLNLAETIIRSLAYDPRPYRAPIGPQDMPKILTADIVLTALFMPQFDGFEVIRAVRAARRDLPVIALAAADSVGAFYLRAARSLGAEITLTRAELPDRLPDVLRRLLAAEGDALEWGEPEG